MLMALFVSSISKPRAHSIPSPRLLPSRLGSSSWGRQRGSIVAWPFRDVKVHLQLVRFMGVMAAPSSTKHAFVIGASYTEAMSCKYDSPHPYFDNPIWLEECSLSIRALTFVTIRQRLNGEKMAVIIGELVGNLVASGNC